MAHGGLEKISIEEFEHTFCTTIFALFHTGKAALAHVPPGPASINSAGQPVGRSPQPTSP